MERKVIRDLVKEAAATIREQEAELATLREENARFKELARAEELVERMEHVGMADGIQGRTTKEKAASLIDSGKSLDVLEEALKLNLGNGSGQFALDGVSRNGSGSPYNAIELALLERHGTR